VSSKKNKKRTIFWVVRFFVVFLRAFILYLIFLLNLITVAATPEEIALAKAIMQQKIDSINAILTNSPFSPIASEELPKIEELTEVLQSVLDKLTPYAE
jgi:hypothetical protein